MARLSTSTNVPKTTQLIILIFTLFATTKINITVEVIMVKNTFLSSSHQYTSSNLHLFFNFFNITGDTNVKNQRTTLAKTNSISIIKI